MQSKGLIAIAVFGMFFCLQAQAIQLGSVADSRFVESGGWTLDGVRMTDTRMKLLNESNFGPAGTYPEAVEITDVSADLTYTILSNFDIFFIGYFENSDEDAFTADELQAMQDWVSDGGTMIITCDEPGFDAVCASFGPVPSGTGANPPVNPTVAGATRPIFDGAFGMPTDLAMAGSTRYFENTGGFMVLAQDEDSNPIVLEALIGDGRVVVFTDVDMIGNDTVSDNAGISNSNDQFLGNLVAYLADEATETFVLNPGINGNWWGGPAKSGEGAQVEMIRTGEVYQLILTFYSYDTEGNQIFLIAVGPVNGGTAELDVFITEGGMWGPDFDPSDVTETAAGTGTVTGFNCGLINVSLNPNSTFEALGYQDIAYDMIRLQEPAGPCPIDF